jgi:DNA-binding NtrC family response regulator
MDRERILVVDDEQGMRLGLTEVLEREGYAVTAVEHGEAALRALAEQPAALVLSDMRMPGIGGADLLTAVHERHPGIAMVMMTAYGTVEDAVTSMKGGARDFLTKPFAPHDLLHLVRRILADPGADAPSRPVRAGRRIVTNSPALARVLAIVEGVAASRAPVLVEGESGTGKELLARHLHEAGPRRARPFVAVNCAALPRELLESELFGHERGAFTGATARKLGKFELASGGTLLLDEVSEMEPALQGKLLRVLQEHEVDRVGGTRPVAIDTRVVATTNRPLRALVASGGFRRDLYYRLHVVPVTLPPLRDRREDIEPLIEHFCRRFRSGRRLAVTAEARAYLQRHPWPGNVRELEHTIERAALLCRDDTVTLADLQLDEEPIAQDDPAATGLAGRTVHEVERQLIFETLRQTNNNRSRAAELLGISVRTLRNKLAEYRASGHMAAGMA